MKQIESFFTVPLSAKPDEQFLKFGNEFVNEWAKAGIQLTLTSSDNLSTFRKASRKVQETAINYLHFNVTVMQELRESGETARNTKQFLWRALARLKFIPPSECLDLIDDEDVVEIYTRDEIQIFRNVRFMEIISHSIEDILCKPWHELGSRSLTSILSMSKIILPFKLGLLRQTVPWNVSEHVVNERGSARNVQFSIHLKHFMPLIYNGSVVAVISTNRSRLIQEG